MSGKYSVVSHFTTIQSTSNLGGNNSSTYSKYEFREKNVLTASTNCLTNLDTQTFNQRRIKSESNILKSLSNSEVMIEKSVECSIATAQELNRQREQLERTECYVDEINGDLRSSKKHIRKMSSFFGGMVSYVTNKTRRKITQFTWSPKPNHGIKVQIRDEDDNEIEELEEGTDIECTYYRKKSFGESDTFNDVVDGHLGRMSASLETLKGLATGLGEELDTQNKILDNLNEKVEKATLQVEKQTKSIIRVNNE